MDFHRLHRYSLCPPRRHTPGAVTATVGVHVAGTPKPSEFLLRFDQTNAFQANEVKQASSSALETSVILCIDQSGSMGRGGSKQVQEALRSSLTETGRWALERGLMGL